VYGASDFQACEIHCRELANHKAECMRFTGGLTLGFGPSISAAPQAVKAA
jgi:hypothetical protein